MQNLAPDFAKVVVRNFIVKMKVGSEWADFGLVNNVKLTYTPIETPPDSYGQTYTRGYKFRAEWNMMQTGEDSVPTIIQSIIHDDSGGVGFFETDGTIRHYIDNVKPKAEYVADGDGGKSYVRVWVERMLSLDEINDYFEL
ncbi:MAG: hypothetical protein Kow0037_00620 [Calditrichia bacterium]